MTTNYTIYRENWFPAPAKVRKIRPLGYKSPPDSTQLVSQAADVYF